MFLAAAESALRGLLDERQFDLCRIGTELANPGLTPANAHVAPGDVRYLELAIERKQAVLAQIHRFIPPDGVPASAALRVARSVARHVSVPPAGARPPARA